MPAILVPVDESTRKRLESLSVDEGSEVSIVASRILRRAVRGARIRRKFDPEYIARVNKDFHPEDLALADSDMNHRYQLLHNEDVECLMDTLGL